MSVLKNLRNLNWYGAALYRYKVYDRIFQVTAWSCIVGCVYLGVSVMQVWNASIHRSWQHYARKERERAELMELIRTAREKGDIPQSKVFGFQ
mmetsp:Transcript_52468/g.125369  ORF Transcript_52468/g.125369 Transcript_52468/m.125369 type:complete len:93 (+) Transcript_52468:154-432(+)